MRQRRRQGRPDIPHHRHAEQQRWANYAQRVDAHGVLRSLSVPLPFQSATIGALNRRKASCAMWTHDLTRFHDYLAESKVTERLKVQGLSG
jgi:hypothetical protein